MQSSFRTIEISNPALTPENLTLVTVHSSNLGGRGDISIYNTQSSANPAPIIILLHGVYGSHWGWMYSAGVHRTLDRLKNEESLSDFVLAMPSDGLNYDGSGYLNRSRGNFEDWIIRDVPNAVIEAIPQTTPDSRIYLCGLSMGGYGALRIGAKYAEQIAGISAHSAVTSAADFAHFTDRSPVEDALDSQDDSSILYWLKQNKNKLPPLRMDCGVEDILLTGNRKLHKDLTDLNIEHAYLEAPGGHDWDYWGKHVEESLRFFDLIEKDLQ